MLSKKIIAPVAAAGFAFAAFTGGIAHASDSAAIEIAVAQQGASDVIKSLASKAMSDLTDASIGEDIRREKFVRLMDEYFEMDVVARFVLGRYWRSISNAEIEEFADLLQEYLALNYANQFKEFDGEQFIVNNEVQQNKDTFVNSQFVRPDGPPVNIVWRMREFDSQYKIIDVSVEGLSMGITQRDEFTSVIQQNGGKVSALMDALRKKTGG